MVTFTSFKDSDPDNFESSPVLKELNGRMPGQEECEDIWDEYAFPGFGENFVYPDLHFNFGDQMTVFVT